ncbi:hypothetical protein KC19_VG187300 [Ceratodon purpureus]|uniref:Uncharacterized protein n=1 Tax=Ceratodon purpureus TaxID=3225 RepID=A0A8T0HSN5_CERPU|nr:hypothetical protein KC19_VG187300 [Ceratodon purpureus]
MKGRGGRDFEGRHCIDSGEEFSPAPENDYERFRMETIAINQLRFQLVLEAANVFNSDIA